ncbi:MAG TPA: hypothetical protein DD979_18555 [Gammaproteobacteria bacterium]|nr:hypothetical protein [Gammaproteobacteria bacterium]
MPQAFAVFPILFVLFIAMPIAEIALLIQLGGMLGFWPTLGLVILTAVIGSMMLRAQSLATLRTVQQEIDAGGLPAQSLLEGVALVVGGVFLLTPGFITDGFGLFCLLPQTRRWLIRRLMANATVQVFGQRGGPRDGATHSHPGQTGHAKTGGGQASPGPGQSSVIEGEFRREDD